MKVMNLFKRDFLIFKRFSFKKFLILYIILILLVIAKLLTERNIFELTNSYLVPSFSREDNIRNNLYYILLLFGGYLACINDFTRDVFCNNWMLVSRCKNKSLLFLSKLCLSFIVLLIFYQVLGLSIYLISKVVGVSGVGFLSFSKIFFIISLSTYSLLVLGVLLSMYIDVNISSIACLIISILTLKFGLIFMPSGLAWMLTRYDIAVGFVILFFVILGALMVIQTYLYTKRDLF